MKCKICGETEPQNMMNKGQGRKSLSLCKKCHCKNTKLRGKNNKKQFIEYKGGCCQKCRYNKCYEALDFHHLDPNEKDPTFKGMRYWIFEKAKKELDKCILLCCRCHREIHANIE